MEDKEEKVGKIEPNEIYIINKINFAMQAGVLGKIYMTRAKSKLEKIDCDKFMDYFTKALAFGKCIALVSFNDKKELNACVVLLLKNNPFEGMILWLEWIWTDGHDLQMGKKYLKRIEDIAKELKIKKIAGATKRGAEAIIRKYGFKEEYYVASKEVKIDENVKKN